VLAELGLPDPTMQGDDLRRGRVRAALLEHEAIRAMLGQALEVDPTLDTPLHEVLEGLLQDGDASVRGGAARMLGMIGSRQAVPSLHEALHDPVDWVRGEVAIALGRICDPSSLTHLAPILDGAPYEGLDERVRHSLARMHEIYLATKMEAELARAAAT